MKQKSNKHITISVWDGTQIREMEGEGREGFVYSEGSNHRGLKLF